MSSTLVSIVTPTYNRAYLLEDTIESVLAQTYQNWEWLIVDDASTDDTEAVVRGHAQKDERIRYIKNSDNGGANFCRNLGVSLARGEYIAFLDSDNRWVPEKLEKQTEVLQHLSEEVAFCYCLEKQIFLDKRTEIIPEKAYSYQALREELKYKNVVDTSTVLIRKKYFDKAGGFDEKFPRLQDWELMLRLVCECGYDGVCLEEILNFNVMQKNSISQDDKKYIDALFLILSKYPKQFYEEDVIYRKIMDATFLTKNMEKYIYCKIEEYYGNDIDLKSRIFEAVTVSLKSKMRFYDLLYAWQDADKDKMYEPFQNKKIAIYGLGKFGKLLYKDLKSRDFDVVYGIDHKVDDFYGLPLRRPEEELPHSDCIIVAAINHGEEIKKELESKFPGDIQLLEEMIQSAGQ